MRGIVLAGGTGSRLYPLTKVTNKHLLPVYDEPMIFKPIRTLKNSGIDNIIIVLGGESIGDVVRVLGNGNELGVDLAFVYQDKAGGIADALYTVRNLVKDEKIAVILGDNIFEDSFDESVREFEAQEEHGCYLFVKEVDDPRQYGIAEFDENGVVVAVEEKPPNPKSNLAVTGLYFYDAGVFSYLAELEQSGARGNNGELEITSLNNMYIEKNKTKIVQVNGFWADAGTRDNLLKASVHFAGSPP
ncbi:MAG TPA: sugar phosphate nucleotidyltransferase [Candidatus Lokiarchaeia archaeon]|nr:sugar phosphate nucleotidyltransferase [Candidatus Lokiarchaeia archaeon]